MSDPPPLLIARKPTQEEEFYLKWALDDLKDSLARLNDAQKGITTIAVSLMGGSIVLYTNAKLSQLGLYVTTLPFLAAAIASVIGSFPYMVRVDSRDPMAFRQSRLDSYYWKRFWCIASFILVGLGLAFALFVQTVLVRVASG